MDEKVKEEYNRLNTIFKGITAGKKETVEGLIQNAAFMRIVLDDLQAEIKEKGYSDIYQNGANQKGTKTAAPLQAYNTTIKNYNAVIKQLVSLLPEKTNGLGFEGFLESLEEALPQ